MTNLFPQDLVLREQSVRFKARAYGAKLRIEALRIYCFNIPSESSDSDLKGRRVGDRAKRTETNVRFYLFPLPDKELVLFEVRENMRLGNVFVLPVS